MILIIVFVQPLNAQQVYFNNLYHVGSGDGLTSVLEIDSGYLCAGGASSKFVLIELDSGGSLIMTKQYGDSGKVYNAGGSGSLIQTSDGGYALGGGRNSGINASNVGMLWRFDANGDTLWTKTFGSTSNYFETLNQCKQTPDSGFILIGATDEPDSGGNTDIWLLKTDKDGNFEWDTTYGGAGIEYGWNILVTSKGEYIFVRGGGIVYMTDEFGNLKWNKTFSASVGYFIETSDGNFVGCGGRFDTTLSGSYSQYTPAVIKIDSAGSVIWQKAYGPSRYVTGGSAIWELPDGSFVTAGQSNNNQGTPNGNGWPIGFILKVSAQGDSIWYREYEYDTCIKNDDYVRDMKPTSDGGFITAGFFFPNTSFQ